VISEATKKMKNIFTRYIEKQINHSDEIKQIKFTNKPMKTEKVALDKDDDLNYDLLNKFLELIDSIVYKSKKSEVQLQIEFKGSILTCKEKNKMIVLHSIRPKNSDNFDEIAFFSNNPYSLKNFLYDRIITNEDIMELEKTAIMIM
jgi:hypothetical protein